MKSTKSSHYLVFFLCLVQVFLLSAQPVLGAAKNLSPSSKSTCVTTPNLTVPTLTAITKTNGHIKLSWSAVSKATGYEIYYSKKQKSGYQLLKTISTASKTSCTIKKLLPGATYYFKIRACQTKKKTTDYSKFSSVSCINLKKNAKIIAIDPGHQRKANSSLEAIGPNSRTKKAKVSSGTQGIATRVPEYQLNLDIALKLRIELQKRGYIVVLIRDTNDVNISNSQRAILANTSGADIFLRLHANGSNNRSANGAFTIYPTSHNPYIASLSKESKRLSEAVIDGFCDATGAKKLPLSARDDLTGTNWSKIPVTLIEMGYMTNASEDKKMQTASYQKKMVVGISNGIDAYFK